MKKANINWIEVIIHLLFWGAAYYTIVSSFSVASVSVEIINGVEVERSSEAKYLLPTLLALALNAAMAYAHAFLVFPTFFLQKKHVQYGLLTLTIYATTVFLIWIADVFYYSAYIDQYGEGASVIDIRIVLVAFFLSISYVYILFKEWLKAQAQKEEIRKEKMQAELQFLRSQINPHFLYNTINSLFSMAQKKEDSEMAEGLSLLADMMRYMLDNSQEELKELKKEIAYIFSYVSLQKLRFEEEDFVTISFETKGEFEGWYIHPMILITLIENAFKHGITNKELSIIDIDLRMEDSFTLIIKNTCEPESEVQTSGIGLENVKKRLNLLYPDAYTLNISTERNMFRVTLNLELERI